MRDAGRFGIASVEPEIDFARVMEEVAVTVGRAAELDDPDLLRSEGVEVIEAPGQFTGPGRVDAGGRELRFRSALIATGSKPLIADVPGLREAEPLTNDDVFELRELPARIAVLGAGPTGCELGQALRRLGAEVTLIERAQRILPAVEPEASSLLEARFRAEGIDLRLDAEPAGVSREDGELRLRLNAIEATEATTIACDRILVATGRQATTADLGLEAVGLRTGSAGEIEVDSRMRTGASHIYAAGDVTGAPYLTHVAGYGGLVAVANALFRLGPRLDLNAIPSVTFCDPEIASAGMTEQAAREHLGRDPLVFGNDHGHLDRALTARAQGFSKLVTDRRGKLLGATLVGPSSGDALAETARLVREGRTLSDLSGLAHAYPTFAESPVRAAEKWWAHRYLTPSTRRMMRPLLAIARTLDSPR